MQLLESTVDNIMLCQQVEQRFKELCDSHLRITQEELVPPAELDTDFILWRKMAVRYKDSDYRHSTDELNALRRIAQWTVDVNRRIRNQKPMSVEWAK